MQDPLFFAVNEDVLFEVLVLVVFLSFVIERALALVFEHRWFIALSMKRKGLKEVLAFGVTLLVVNRYGLDVLAVVFQEPRNMLGYLVTAGLIAGGSKGSTKLFRDFFGWKSKAQERYEKGESLD